MSDPLSSEVVVLDPSVTDLVPSHNLLIDHLGEVGVLRHPLSVDLFERNPLAANLEVTYTTDNSVVPDPLLVFAVVAEIPLSSPLSVSPPGSVDLGPSPPPASDFSSYTANPLPGFWRFCNLQPVSSELEMSSPSAFDKVPSYPAPADFSVPESQVGCWHPFPAYFFILDPVAADHEILHVRQAVCPSGSLFRIVTPTVGRWDVQHPAAGD